MNRKALVVIDIQNDITKHYRDIIENINSVMNKVTGGMLFLFPLTLTVINLKYSAVVVCAVATTAAIQEGYLRK